MLTECERPAPQAHSRASGLVVAVVGATGAVGQEILGCLERRQFPVSRIKLFASSKSAGQHVTFAGEPHVLEELSDGCFDDVDIALFSAGARLSRRFAPLAVAAGALVVDNSSAFRMTSAVPLVVPEANGADLAQHDGLIANPNCVAAIASVVLAPLADLGRIERVQLATYQAASGAGAAAMEELRQSTAAHLEGRAFAPNILPHPAAFNVFSHNADVDPETGYNEEELKVIAELRRIFARPDLAVGVTCVRVPVLRAHGMAMTVVFDTPVSCERARNALQSAPGVQVVDDRARNHFPMPCEASGAADVLVGRLRSDLGDPSGRSLALFVVGDQLLKGAALNAVQIAERLVSQRVSERASA